MRASGANALVANHSCETVKQTLPKGHKSGYSQVVPVQAYTEPPLEVWM